MRFLIIAALAILIAPAVQAADVARPPGGDEVRSEHPARAVVRHERHAVREGERDEEAAAARRAERREPRVHVAGEPYERPVVIPRDLRRRPREIVRFRLVPEGSTYQQPCGCHQQWW